MKRGAPLVLVVDDFAAGRELCAEYLSFRGYEVATATDGAEALNKAFELEPDVILMDLSLPAIDGWEATRRLRSDPRTRAIKIIALTAHALEAERARALEAGCDEVVTKPVIPRELELVVRRQLGRETTPAEDRASERGAR
ncbi:MAG TPA: response regulator [Thermoanaerobaculia bacterium]|nr:response regulator [Thermoanaerobaculia bacterium]